ncbi:uncharacterized protein LOC106053537 [Biomphalaria glabrata]|uniref:Uncharacterized protein LOC106053537 n=1 Tax=Biomphalaria glabrata TaxID=6526 RepID=A0A9U8DWL5_BIOGL|nr:uncharacterized protein LOC106053537 [Biomphalaria glabrata]
MSCGPYRSSIQPQVIDGFKIEIDSDVAHQDYYNDFVYTERHYDNKMSTASPEKFVIDLNKSVVPSPSVDVSLRPRDCTSSSLYRALTDSIHKRRFHEVSPFTGPSTTHPVNESTPVLSAAHLQGKALDRSKLITTFPRDQAAASSSIAVVEREGVPQGLWGGQVVPLDLSKPKSHGSALSCNNKEDSSGKRRHLAGSHKETRITFAFPPTGNTVVRHISAYLPAPQDSDNKEEITKGAHVVYKPTPTYPTLFHTPSFQGEGRFTNFINTSGPQRSLYDTEWMPNVTGRWGCCNKYLWDNDSQYSVLGERCRADHNAYPWRQAGNRLSNDSISFSGECDLFKPSPHEPLPKSGLDGPCTVHLNSDSIKSSSADADTNWLQDMGHTPPSEIRKQTTKMKSNIKKACLTLPVKTRRAKATSTESKQKSHVAMSRRHVKPRKSQQASQEMSPTYKRLVKKTANLKDDDDDDNRHRGKNKKATPKIPNISIHLKRCPKDSNDYIFFPSINKPSFRQRITNNAHDHTGMMGTEDTGRDTRRNTAQTFCDLRDLKSNQPLGLTLNILPARHCPSPENKHSQSHSDRDNKTMNAISKNGNEPGSITLPKKENSDNSGKFGASFVCGTCKTKCDSLFTLLEHQNKDCQFRRKVYHATDCLANTEGQECQCTNCSFCHVIFNSKFRVFSHCLKSCYVKNMLSIATEEQKSLPGGATKRLNVKDTHVISIESSGDEEFQQALQQNKPNKKIHHSKLEHKVHNTYVAKSEEKNLASTQNVNITNAKASTSALSDSKGKALDCTSDDNLSRKDISESNLTGLITNSEEMKNLEDSTFNVKKDSCLNSENKLGQTLSKQYTEQFNEVVVTQHTHPTGFKQQTTDNEIQHPNELTGCAIETQYKVPNQTIKIELEDSHITISDTSVQTSPVIISDKTRQTSPVIISDKIRQTNHVIPSDTLTHTKTLDCRQHVRNETLEVYLASDRITAPYDRNAMNIHSKEMRLFSTPEIKHELISPSVANCSLKHEVNMFSTDDRDGTLASRSHQHSNVLSQCESEQALTNICSSNPKRALVYDREASQYSFNIEPEVKKKRRSKYQISSGVNFSSVLNELTPPVQSSAIAFGASQRITKSGEKERITYLLDANNKPLMLVEKEQKENSIMRCEKCFQCFPTFLFLTWHVKYTCPYSSIMLAAANSKVGQSYVYKYL